jgi:serine/threonine protein kinase
MKGIISNDEAWFISPEIIYNYSYREHQAKHKHINSEHLEHQIEHNPFKSDAFSLGLICFEMMTLGRMT